MPRPAKHRVPVVPPSRTEPAAIARTGRWPFIACYALSGAAALLYQVVWTRLLALDLGHTVAASSTVLAAFMGGLCAGAWLASRVAATQTRPLRLYAGLELAIAVVAITLPTALAACRPLLVSAYADGHAPLQFSLTRLALGLVLVGLPAAAMGATFPIAATWLASVPGGRSHRARPATDVAVAYAANTAGAAVGALAAGFWLIPALGLRATTWVGATLNVVAAVAAWQISRGHFAEPPTERPASIGGADSGRRRQQDEDAAAPRLSWIACGAVAVSGFCGLVYEVTWTRLLALVIGPTTYAFATMVAAFVSGIAIGSAIAARAGGRVRQPALWLAATVAATGVCASLTAWFTASHLPLIVAYRLAAGASGDDILMYEVFTVFFLLLPIGMLLGAAFTFAVMTASPATVAVGRETARLYVANTVGAVAGALAAGFTLIDWLGLQATIDGASRAGAIGGVAVGAYVLAMKRDAKRPFVVAASILAVGAIALLQAPRWDRVLLSSGAYKYSQAVGADALELRLRAGTLEYYREGAAATVSVRQFAGTRSLSVDGKVDASNGADMLTQRLLGILPVLLHPRPEDMLVIGLGSGVTVGSALASGAVRHVDVVEISPQVVEASSFFAADNGNAQQSPAVRLIVGDGRSHLRLTSDRYDVIVSEPSNPWMAGVATLFTREFFESARARLKSGGLLCQWTHLYEMTESDFASIVATFAAVFPEATMWLVGESDLLLIGTNGTDMEARLEGVAARSQMGELPALWSALGGGSSAPFVLLSQFAGGPLAFATIAAGAALQTDDRLLLEFTAPRAMYARTAKIDERLLRPRSVPPAVAAVVQAADSRDWTARGNTALKAEAYTAAYESFLRAVMLDARNAAALRGAFDVSVRAQRLDDLRASLTALAAEHRDNAPVRIELSHLLAASGNVEGAIAAAIEAAQIEPESPAPLEQLASIYEDLGDAERLTAIADELIRRFPERESSGYYRAASLFISGRTAEASTAIRAVLGKNPQHARGQNLLGIACAAEGRQDCARQAFEASIQLTPRDPSPYVNVALFHLKSGNASTAARYFADALALDTSSTAAREGLAQARAAGGLP